MKAKVGDLIRYGSTDLDEIFIYTGIARVIKNNTIRMPYLVRKRNVYRTAGHIDFLFTMGTCEVPGVECRPIEKVKKPMKLYSLKIKTGW